MHEEDESSEALQALNRLAPEEDTLTNQRPNREEKEQKEAAMVRTVALNVARQRKPRLVIDHMVLEDFKSYAGRQVVGKFHGSFTSVVGPNGSGKSNLIESMLFIFGFNASWMRLNKLNQLIHNSSSSTGNTRAAVEVHFKKVQETAEGQLVDVPGSEFWIRRTVNSGSVSKYFMGGRESTQAEVKDRLKGEGIDLGNNRFLILQGEVEQISQMKQKSGDRDKPGLLEYLQQIIGSAQYIERIEECAREYAVTEEQKHQKGQLMRLVQNQLKSMSKAKDEAVRYVKKENKVFQTQNIYRQVLANNAREQLQTIRQAAAQLQKTRDRIVAEERERLKTQSERIREIKKNKGEQEEAQKQLEKYQEACNKMGVEDKHLTQEITFKSQDLVKFERKAQEADRELTRIIAQCEDIRQKLPSSKEALAARTVTLEAMRTELAKHQKPHLRQKVRDSEVQLSRHQQESGTLRSKLESVKAALGKAKSGRGQLQGKLKDYETRATETRKQRDNIDKAKGIAEAIVQTKGASVQQLGRQRDSLREELRQLEGELRQQMTHSEEQGQMGSLFREVMQQNFPGVLGRLGDLGEVSKEYDQIITTCCPRLDNIVVTDLPTASAVLDFLKSRRLGRATCIILDKIAEQRHFMNRPFEKLPQAVRLFDQVKYRSEQAKLAFYFALNDTLFCEDSNLGLEYSMKNDHQRRRVVCRNRARTGYITYEMNGLMVGSTARRGGFVPKGGKGKPKNHPEAQAALQARKKQLLSKIDDLGRALAKEEAELKSASQDIDQIKREYRAACDSIKEFEEEVRDLKDMIAKAEARTGNARTEERQAEALAKELERVEASRAAAEKVLRALEEEQKAGEAKAVVELREKYKKERAEVSAAEKEFEHNKAVLESSLKRIEEVKKGKVDSQRKSETSKRQIDQFKAQQVELEKKVSEIIGKMTAYEEKLRECKRLETDLRKLMEDDQKEVRESKAKVQKARRDVQNAQQNLKKKGEELVQCEEELQKVRKSYRELIASYSFLESLEELEGMTLGQAPSNTGANVAVAQEDQHSSILETSMLNSSLDASTSRIFQGELLMRTSPLADLSPDQLEHFSLFKDKLFGIITAESAELKKMEGSNLEVINEFRQKYAHYKERLREFEAVRERQKELKRIIDTLKDERLRLFREGFGVINSKLKEVYQHLTRGGDAQLELIDALDPFSDGVNFSVRPPKKSWKEVNKLSGGEKTLSSLSLIFALHYYKPTPLYFMDEIDAALDFKNVAIVADYIKKRTRDAQFIIISLRNNMFDLADKLVGVYKTNDKTRVINLDPSHLLNKHHKENQDRANRGK